MMPNSGSCVFCGATPTNSEDIIPRWLVRFLRLIPPATRRFGRTFADRTDLGGAGAQSVAGIGVGKVKAVCKNTCNNGWMKRLEDQAKPILQDLLLKEDPKTLDLESQEILATWATKTATMLAIKYSKLPSRELLTPLSEQGRPAPTAIVWMARVQPATVRVGSGPLLSRTFGDPPHTAQGFIARLTLGNVGFAVFGNPAPRGGTWMMAQSIQDRFKPIWPPQGPLQWPIGSSVTANDLDAFALLVRSVVTSNRPLPSAPAHHVFPFDRDERTPDVRHEPAGPPSGPEAELQAGTLVTARFQPLPRPERPPSSLPPLGKPFQSDPGPDLLLT
jgi:hypothetical protein